MIGMDSIPGMSKTNAMNFWKIQIIILKIYNFDLVFNKDKLWDQKIKQYQEIDHKQIMKYPEREREQIMSSIFRDSRRQGMFIQKETVHKHFKVNSKSIGGGRFVQKLKNDHYKETW